MIKSIWRITFTPLTGRRAGEAILLLDFDELMEAEPALPISQGVAESVPLFSPFGHAFALGGAKTTATWTRRREVETMPRSIAMREVYEFPWGHSGRITVWIAGGETWAWDRSALESIEPSYPLQPDKLLLQQKFQARCGKMLFLGLLPWYPAIPGAIKWERCATGICPTWENITTQWEDILAEPVT